MKSRQYPALPFPQSYQDSVLKSSHNAVIKPVKIEHLMAKTNDTMINKYKSDHPREESRTEQYRKYMKPLLERKRRARINKCLDELKDLMLNVAASSSQGNQNHKGLDSKLEKADILEVTVNYLKTLKQTNSLVLNENHMEHENSRRLFQIGYQACGEDVTQFLSGVAAAHQPASKTAADNLVKSVLAASNTTKNFPKSELENPPNFMLNSEPKLLNNNNDFKFCTAKGVAPINMTLTNQNEGVQCNIKKEESWRPW